MKEFITELEIDKALDYLRDGAADLGAAKEHAIMTERMVKHTLALLMKEHSDLPVSAQQREAMADERYRMAIWKEAQAAGALEIMRGLREAAALKIEAWRTMVSSIRMMKL